MFVGRVLQRWLHDEQGSVQAITFDFLKDNTTNIDDDIYMESLMKMVQIKILHQSIKLLLVH